MAQSCKRNLTGQTDPPPELTLDLDLWEVTLNTGGIVRLRAHGYTEQDGFYILVALMRGTPNYEYELARFPVASVSDVQGGW
jgi:hypothetical protein